MWNPPGARRVALVVGALIALLILAMLVWLLADSRRSPLDSVDPVMPVGAAGPENDNPSPVVGEGLRPAPG